MRSITSITRRSKNMPLNLPLSGDGDEAEEGREEEDGKPPVIAGTTLASSPALSESGVGVPKAASDLCARWRYNES